MAYGVWSPLNVARHATGALHLSHTNLSFAFQRAYIRLELYADFTRQLAGFRGLPEVHPNQEVQGAAVKPELVGQETVLPAPKAQFAGHLALR